MSATVGGQADIVRQMLAKGANANTKPKYQVVDWQAIDYAAAIGRKDIVDILLTNHLGSIGATEYLAGSIPLGLAVFHGDLELTERLLKAGAPVNEYQTTFRHIPGGRITPLMIAVFNEDMPMIELLLSHGADPHILTGYHDRTYSVLHFAARLANHPMIERLLKQGQRPLFRRPALIYDRWMDSKSINICMQRRSRITQCLFPRHRRMMSRSSSR